MLGIDRAIGRYMVFVLTGSLGEFIKVIRKYYTSSTYSSYVTCGQNAQSDENLIQNIFLCFCCCLYPTKVKKILGFSQYTNVIDQYDFIIYSI